VTVTLSLLFATLHATAQNAPAARAGQTAVWSGSEMLGWGGWAMGALPYPGSAASSGGRYQVSANSWKAIPCVGISSPATYFQTAVWTGSNMIVWGGGSYDIARNFYPTSAGGRYDPLLNNWVATTNAGAPSARGLHTAVWT